jgi:CxxC-x17-CxxC domain-containing protein
MTDFKKVNKFGVRGRAPGFGAHVSAARSAESHKTTCSQCHAMCEVPFKPNGKKPVYCRNCYKGKETTTSFTGQPFTSTDSEGSNDMKKQFSILNTKLDRLISAIEAQTEILRARD